MGASNIAERGKRLKSEGMEDGMQGGEAKEQRKCDWTQFQFGWGAHEASDGQYLLHSITTECRIRS